MRLTARLAGRTLGSHVLAGRGPFSVVLDLPAGQAAGEAELTLEFDRDWQPGGGDFRHVACIIDSVRVL